MRYCLNRFITGGIVLNIQIYGKAKCFDTKKAERWFKERRIKYQYIDVLSKGLSPREYQSVKQKVGFEALVNTKSRTYEDLGDQYQRYMTQAAWEEKLLEYPEFSNVEKMRNVLRMIEDKEGIVGELKDIDADIVCCIAVADIDMLEEAGSGGSIILGIYL